MIIEVFGTPAPQGSKKGIGNNRFIEASKKLPAWRKAVRDAGLEVMKTNEKLTGPVSLEVTFYLQRGKTVKREYPTVAPDSSKLLRAIEDSLTDAEVWIDDAYVIHTNVKKYYADDREPGCVITVTAL